MFAIKDYAELRSSEVVLVLHKISKDKVNKIMTEFSTCIKIYRWLIIGCQWEDLKSIEKYWGKYFDVNVIMLPEHVDIDVNALNLILEAENIDRKHSVIISSEPFCDLPDDGFLHAEILEDSCENYDKILSNVVKILDK